VSVHERDNICHRGHSDRELCNDRQDRENIVTESFIIIGKTYEYETAAVTLTEREQSVLTSHLTDMLVYQLVH